MPWCKFFIPKIAAPGVKPDDPDFNDNVMYAKCIKGHVLKDANDWILCENLPAPDAQCWQEGGDTIFSLMARQRRASQDQMAKPNIQQDQMTKPNIQQDQMTKPNAQNEGMSQRAASRLTDR